MREDWWQDDEELFARLRQAQREGPALRAFIEAGKAVFVPPDIDAELAALSFDSGLELAATRADTATLRSLVFEGPRTRIELDVLGDGLMGQLIPPAVVAVDLVLEGGPAASTHADDLGVFRFHTLPHERFRLHCHDPSGMEIVTSWISL
jgi:hypothetical protein